jgi:hypothetical protein
MRGHDKGRTDELKYIEGLLEPLGATIGRLVGLQDIPQLLVRGEGGFRGCYKLRVAPSPVTRVFNATGSPIAKLLKT